ncbi:D-2-hydroxyacid dehydrogenase family protein [Marinomonas sp. 15G1-11]|uniref:D-2-hydroxyacid dehydrogenase family protein n=1 Tax=Marinomonas phaeophyticola TaxID=3004091 RepID=A0ABT4JZE1_9GAMM|nr:D-2-hydroxyacid dehydrogenase family protein [Marinomonas sp. 15G1-11]MCZ2723138.1 D-2-hydroxyacid dehydrogenase family protein [Marinomonas sp. 15G1-11]
MKIAILDDYQDVVRQLDCFTLLADHDVTVLTASYSEETLIEQLQHVEAIVLIRERTLITESLLAGLPQLKLISQTGKVSNHIDVELCKKYGVDVIEGIGSPVAPSELCWALIMSASRHIPSYADRLQQGQWQQSGILGLGRTLNGLTLGIWGYGKIGQRIAQYAKAFGMEVLIWGREPSRKKAVQDGFSSAVSKDAFFTASDIVTLHLRLNEVTRSCVTQSDLRSMKADSLLVNTSRAELIEKNALLEELTRVQTKRAAIDVYDIEPATPAIEPLIQLENVLALPHLGYVEHNSYQLYFKVAFENILKYLQAQNQTE